MALIKEVRGFKPRIGKGSYIAENATIIGDVVIGEECSIWFNAIIRGDVNSIRIGDGVNIQDGAVLHCNYNDSVVTIGNNVSVGHNAIIHGAEIKSNVLVGMGAIIMDHAVIGENSVIAAGAVVTKHTVIPPGSVYGGMPARLIKQYEPSQLGRMTGLSAENYKKYLKWFEEEE